MTTRTVLLIESAILTPETSPTAMPLIADRRTDGGLALTTLDEATRIELHADDLAALGIDHWGEMAKAAKLVWLPGQR